MLTESDKKIGVGEKTDRGRNMVLISGRKFFPNDPKPEEIFIEDIAHSLAYQCRFNGHTKSFYSVAQHSVLVSLNVSPKFQLEGLLHDAPEAYIGDMIRPLKVDNHLFMEIDKKLDRVCRKRFGLPLEMSPEVHEMDMILCATEKRDLIEENSADWGKYLPDPLEDIIVPMGPDESKEYFLNRWEELNYSHER